MDKSAGKDFATATQAASAAAAHPAGQPSKAAVASATCAPCVKDARVKLSKGATDATHMPVFCLGT